MTCRFLPDKTGKTFFANGLPVYSNIVQSPTLKNCHMVAALSSLAWINNKYFSPAQNAAVCSFKFYDRDPNPVRGDGKGQYPQNIDITKLKSDGMEVSVTTNIFMDDQNFSWCQASSKLAETWPALWEKAFAKFCMFKIKKSITYKQLVSADTDPDFSTLPKGSDWGGNPSTCLSYLTNGSVNPKPYTTFSSFKLNSAEIYKFIRSLCVTNRIGTNATGLGIYNGAKTKYPMGAWTYQDAASAKTIANVDITYKTTTIAADHCYSILGIYEDNTGQYIVLRNPYGNSDPEQVAVGKGPWIFYDTQYQIGNMVPLGAGKEVSFDFSNVDGIFALDVKVFSQYFEGFGYVSPLP
jgi:hypothetical protein